MDDDLRRAHADLDESHWWFRGRRRIIESTLHRHVQKNQQPVLDVGCGAGGLLAMLQTFGPVTAVEGDPGAVEAARARNPSADVRQGNLPEVIQTLPAAAHLVTAFDVLEHLDDDIAVLRQMVGRLRPGGVVCTTVPALQWLWSSHDEANGHRRRYSAKRLRKTMRAAGLEVVHLSYFNSLLLPMVALSRIAERVRGPVSGGDFARSLGPLDRVLETVLSAERHVVPYVRIPLGVSLISIGRAAA